MNVILYHKHYDQQHLDEVKKEMEIIGAPEIRAIWSEIYEAWLAIEGCHRLRAAYELEINPIIIDITNDEIAIIQIDGKDEEVNVIDLTEELNDDACKSDIITFN